MADAIKDFEYVFAGQAKWPTLEFAQTHDTSSVKIGCMTNVNKYLFRHV